MVRCFIGYILPEKTKEEISEIKKKLFSKDFDCKFVENENLHINFSFLGEIEETDIEEIKNKLNEIANNYSKFLIYSANILLIPNKNYVRVLALSAEDQNRYLQSISSEILKKIGGDSKPPHITLCRIHKIKNKNNFLKTIGETEVNISEFYLDSIQLIKSELSKLGPKYSVIHESKLM